MKVYWDTTMVVRGASGFNRGKDWFINTMSDRSAPKNRGVVGFRCCQIQDPNGEMAQ